MLKKVTVSSSYHGDDVDYHPADECSNPLLHWNSEQEEKGNNMNFNYGNMSTSNVYALVVQSDIKIEICF